MVSVGALAVKITTSKGDIVELESDSDITDDVSTVGRCVLCVESGSDPELLISLVSSTIHDIINNMVAWDRNAVYSNLDSIINLANSVTKLCTVHSENADIVNLTKYYIAQLSGLLMQNCELLGRYSSALEQLEGYELFADDLYSVLLSLGHKSTDGALGDSSCDLQSFLGGGVVDLCRKKDDEIKEFINKRKLRVEEGQKNRRSSQAELSSVDSDHAVTGSQAASTKSFCGDKNALLKENSKEQAELLQSLKSMINPIWCAVLLVMVSATASLVWFCVRKKSIFYRAKQG